MYIYSIDEGLTQAVRGDKVDGLEATSFLKMQKKERELQIWLRKMLREQHFNKTKEVRVKKLALGFKRTFENRDTKSH